MWDIGDAMKMAMHYWRNYLKGWDWSFLLEGSLIGMISIM